jgi:hypothetical protein
MGTRRKSLRQKWAQIPFERKIAMFVAPIFVFVVTTVVIPKLLGQGKSDPGPRPTFGGDEQIEVVDLAPINSLKEPTRIEIAVRNIGGSVSVLTRAEFRIERTDYIDPCAPSAVLGVSKTYDLELPLYPDDGEVVPVRTSQQIGPNEADRFAFEVGVVTPSGQESSPVVYQLGVSLLHDGKETPVKAGTVVIAEPFPENSYFSLQSWLDTGMPREELQSCVSSNIERIASVLSLDGERSTELTQLAQAVRA